MTSPRLHRTGRRPALRRMLAAALCAGAASVSMTNDGLAQLPGPPGKYTMVDQNMPVGVAAKWMSLKDPGGMPYMQPIRVDLPSDGEVTFLDARGAMPVQKAPAQAALMVGHTYRLKVTGMPEFPGAEIYPSVEVLDRLHPPRGKQHDFPVLLELTREDIELALDGGLVTKVIYLEQPSLAKPVQQDRPLSVQEFPPATNLLTEADLIGRPMLLIRIGGRLPDFRNPDPAFFGSGGPVLPSKLKTEADPPARVRVPVEGPVSKLRRSEGEFSMPAPSKRVTPASGVR